MKKTVLTLALFNAFCVLNAQKIITGTVRDENKNPLSNVNIQDPQTKKWTQTSTNGEFKIEVSNDNTYLIFSQQGKDPQEILVDPTEFSMNIILYRQSLRLSEITVTAKKKKVFSEISLGKEAIENVQAFSLDDVLKQLPGQITTSLNLNQFKNIVFRTAIDQSNVTKLQNSANDNKDYFGNKAFGTSLVLNGIPLSNNENMQSFNPNSTGAYSYHSGSNFGLNATDIFANANYGVDLREVSTNNIEEIEIVQGIPSVKYGDLTSGLILIKSSVGKTPYRFGISLQDATTEYNFSKGTQVGKDNFLMFGLSYMDSNADTRTSLTNYERINGSISWKYNDPNRRFTNTLNASFNFNLDNVNANPDDIKGPIVKNDKQGIRLSNNFNYRFDKTWVDGLNVDASFSYDNQLSRKSVWLNQGTSAVSTATENGIHPAILLPNQYTYTTNVEGIPIATFLNAELFKTIETSKKWKHTLIAGISARTSSNKGRGRFSDDNLVPNFYSLSTGTNGSAGLGYRDYNFSNTKTEGQYAFYLQDKIQKYWEGNRVLTVDAGLRIDNQLGYTTIQPRANASYGFNKILRVRGGYGISSKSPSLNQLYTGDRVYDRLVTDIINVPGKGNFAWIETFMLPGNNMDLKPTKSYKSEIGFDLNLPFASLNVTGYYNRLTDGFTSQSHPFMVQGSLVDVILNGQEAPSYSVTGKKPVYFFTNQLVNGLESIDKGLEMFLTFKRIESLHLDLGLKASYVESDNKSSVSSYSISKDILANETYGVYAPRSTYDKSFILGGDISYHIPKVGLLMSLRTEHILLQSHDRNKTIYPSGYLDRDFNYHAIATDDQADKYPHLVNKTDDSADKLQKVIHNIHFRLSKDFLNGFKVSVYSTNILGLKPLYRDANNTQTIYPIAKFAIGAKVNYEF